MADRNSDLSPGRRDVEKRWSDPGQFRWAAGYAVVVILIALALLAAFAATGGDNRALALAVPAVFGLGGVGALFAGIGAYSRKRPWVPWQGAGWFLLVIMLFALSVPYSAW